MSNAVYPVIDGLTHAGKAIYTVLSGVTHKVNVGYAVSEGKYRQIYGSAVLFAYTGDFTRRSVTINGVACNLYTLITSGQLTIEGASVQYWMCGGGESGQQVSVTNSGVYTSGRGGNGGHTASGRISAGTYVVTIGAGGEIGAAGGVTQIGNRVSAAGGDSEGGGSGGGSGSSGRLETTTELEAADIGRGDGVSTVPFDADELDAKCPGGGGGGMFLNYRYRKGGDGGSDGADGSSSVIDGSNTAGGYGGEKGGGDGGNGGGSSVTDGMAATDYGGGGGGAGLLRYGYDSSSNSNGRCGAGYQGVLYALIPAEVDKTEITYAVALLGTLKSNRYITIGGVAYTSAQNVVLYSPQVATISLYGFTPRITENGEPVEQGAQNQYSTITYSFTIDKDMSIQFSNNAVAITY